MTESQKAYLNISAYRFLPIESPELLKSNLEDLCVRHGVRGTILVAPEGLNLALSALEATMRAWIKDFEAMGYGGFWYKESYSDHLPFDRLQVKHKREIISVRNEKLDPLSRRAKKISPDELKAWLDEGRDFTLLDTRNIYEVRMGTFEKARDLGIEEFQDFEKRLHDNREALGPKKPMVMFCTGGIRCEKAAFAASDAGFEEVYQLEGGVLNYFEKCGGDHWKGECFVFDKRVGVLPNLEESKSILCWACGEPLGVEDQKSEAYVYKESCPYCVKKD